MIDSMEKGYKVNGHVVQFLDVMCGDAWKKKGYHGPVICNYADGAEYQGEWQEGKRHGVGTYISPTGTRYEGEWENDGASGHGVCHYADGMKYEGQFESGERHGKGVLISPEGDRYEGQFKYDLLKDNICVIGDGKANFISGCLMLKKNIKFLVVIIMGIYPSLFLDVMHVSVENLIDRYQSALANAQYVSLVWR